MTTLPIPTPKAIGLQDDPECPFCSNALEVLRRDGDLITGNCQRCRETVQVMA